MNIEELYSLIALGEQTRNVELKRSISWDEPVVKAKVVKAVLGISNIRNGGFFILGVEEEEDGFNPVGMTDEHLSTFNYDHIATEVSRYADPYAIFRMEIVEDSPENKKFLVFTIDEFNEIPIVCKRNGIENLREGAIYTRSRRMPSTVQVPTQSEMREILSIAIEKGIRTFIEQSRRAGLRLELTEEDVNEEYDEELAGIR
jgi:predicted HTH transcriptional regulator